MWIILNGRPINVFNIADISEIIKVDSKYLVDSYETILRSYTIEPLPKDNPEGKTSFEDLQKDAKGKNTVWGYMFYITVSSITEKGTYSSFKVVSKTYAKESAAKAALEHLLTELNDIEGKVRKIEI